MPGRLARLHRGGATSGGQLVGPDGVFIVDTQFAPLSEKITVDLDARVQQPGTTGERFVRQAYAD